MIPIEKLLNREEYENEFDFEFGVRMAFGSRVVIIV
jgi:hypothetical protein